jgi:hypothetical protein
VPEGVRLEVNARAISEQGHLCQENDSLATSMQANLLMTNFQNWDEGQPATESTEVALHLHSKTTQQRVQQQHQLSKQQRSTMRIRKPKTLHNGRIVRWWSEAHQSEPQPTKTMLQWRQASTGCWKNWFLLPGCLGHPPNQNICGLPEKNDLKMRKKQSPSGWFLQQVH